MSNQDDSATVPYLNQAEGILNFWFGDPADPTSEYGQQRQIWFKKDPEFDVTLRQHFLEDYEMARQGQLEAWKQAPRPCLALILLLDQVPRNIFRDLPQSFATDPQALDAARYGVDRGWDQFLIPVERIFLYLPFEHSEDLADQDISLSLFQSLGEGNPELETTLDYAKRHRDVIRRFGRFPHRNGILHRASTPEEADFLKQPGSRF
jgi:uncharacterized protein (DUF924 family)